MQLKFCCWLVGGGGEQHRRFWLTGFFVVGAGDGDSEDEAEVAVITKYMVNRGVFNSLVGWEVVSSSFVVVAVGPVVSC